MKSRVAILLLAAAVGCEPSTPPAPYKGDAQGEPGRLKVQHVLIAFSGAERAEPSVKRSQDEAEVLAGEILARAKRGEDFEKLAKDYSNDQGKGIYSLVNHGFPASRGETKRGSFAEEFTRVAFSLKVGEVGLASYDKRKSPFGYHIIKRLE
jgi:peptidyl-prolyl cis-trans isomerase D